MKLWMKNMMANRRHNIWLFIELLIVTIVTWIVVDPVVMLCGIAMSQHGYDTDRLIYMELGVEKSETPADSVERANAFDALFTRIKSIDGVESATVVSSWMRLESGSSMPMKLNYINEAGDTVGYDVFRYPRPMDKDYFTTYGITATKGGPSAEELSAIAMGPRDIIVNESVARKMFGDGGDYFGKETVDNGDGKSYRIVGVVDDVRPWHWRSLWRILWLDESHAECYPEYETTAFIARLNKGINPKRWVNTHSDEIYTNFKVGDFYIRSLATHSDVSENTWQSQMARNTRQLKIALLVFFLVNLALGVTGTLYLQTRKRSHDAGIMKSFGANRTNIFNSLVGESMVITIIAWLAGCLIYLNYAYWNGLSLGIDWELDDLPFDSWISNFWQHFAVVSIVVLAIMSVIVFIGAYLPARRIAKVDPVEALRND